MPELHIPTLNYSKPREVREEIEVPVEEETEGPTDASLLTLLHEIEGCVVAGEKMAFSLDLIAQIESGRDDFRQFDELKESEARILAQSVRMIEDAYNKDVDELNKHFESVKSLRHASMAITDVHTNLSIADSIVAVFLSNQIKLVVFERKIEIWNGYSLLSVSALPELRTTSIVGAVRDTLTELPTARLILLQANGSLIAVDFDLTPVADGMTPYTTAGSLVLDPNQIIDGDGELDDIGEPAPAVEIRATVVKSVDIFPATDTPLFLCGVGPGFVCASTISGRVAIIRSSGETTRLLELTHALEMDAVEGFSSLARDRFVTDLSEVKNLYSKFAQLDEADLPGIVIPVNATTNTRVYLLMLGAALAAVTPSSGDGHAPSGTRQARPAFNSPAQSPRRADPLVTAEGETPTAPPPEPVLPCAWWRAALKLRSFAPRSGLPRALELPADKETVWPSKAAPVTVEIVQPIIHSVSVPTSGRSDLSCPPPAQPLLSGDMVVPDTDDSTKSTPMAMSVMSKMSRYTRKAPTKAMSRSSAASNYRKRMIRELSAIAIPSFDPPVRRERQNSSSAGPLGVVVDDSVPGSAKDTPRLEEVQALVGAAEVVFEGSPCLAVATTDSTRLIASATNTVKTVVPWLGTTAAITSITAVGDVIVAGLADSTIAAVHPSKGLMALAALDEGMGEVTAVSVLEGCRVVAVTDRGFFVADMSQVLAKHREAEILG
ncbi:hypothetical protein J8273_0647 [Carpediemonas membranifera]|uniref:Uncharacterized protein n=1 Tax=Carpediemonas membranifera TaxID=201153 RepID=A0A8J6BCT3_9EUKA|nr:hypothetical protein J8273_0647 [Carpediemonas membranifera]|eukprot:KAG9397517.1 hypothetical protein J8273_0647 [Carpediemonas membranifera]